LELKRRGDEDEEEEEERRGLDWIGWVDAWYDYRRTQKRRRIVGGDLETRLFL
jgi:hypothetical protein